MQVHRGVKGVVVDQSGRHLESAAVLVTNSSGPEGKNVTTSSRGEFWKLLVPGQYRLTAQVGGCEAEPVQFVVSDVKQLVQVNITINTQCRQRGPR